MQIGPLLFLKTYTLVECDKLPPIIVRNHSRADLSHLARPSNQDTTIQRLRTRLFRMFSRVGTVQDEHEAIEDGTSLNPINRKSRGVRYRRLVNDHSVEEERELTDASL